MENLWNAMGVATPFVTAIVFGAIAFFGRETFKSVLQNEFSTSLEDYKKSIQKELSEFTSSLKKEENKELAKLTGEITRATEEFKTTTGRSLDRKIRFNEKEYEGLSECWLLLRTTFEVINEIGLEPSMLLPIENMDEIQLNQYLTSLGLDENQQSTVNSSPEKTKLLFHILSKKNEKIIKSNCDRFLESLYKYQLFFDEDIYADFHELFAISENIWFKKNQISNPNISEETKLKNREYILENKGVKSREKMSRLIEKIKENLNK